MSVRIFLFVLKSALGLAAFANVGQAQEFYAGKTVTMMVGYAAGSGYDVNARFIARHMPKYIPGNPQMIVQNMPGGGALGATNHVANIAAKDGTVIALVARGMGLEPLFGGQGVRYDALKLNWIGSSSREVSVIAVRADAGVTRLEDVMTKEIVVAGPSPGTDGVTFPNMLNNLLGTKFRIVTGYRSGKEMAMAVMRGEVQGRGSWSWASFKTEAMENLKKGELKLLLQLGFAKAPELPDVPLVMDFARNAEQRQIIELLLAGQAMAWPVFAPADVPAERVVTLRRA
jgi:tripartite-type tricarboxylate transporter receptor subunit TctC